MCDRAGVLCRRGQQVSGDGAELYELLLQSSPGFSNPANVDYLLTKLGIRDTESHSLMRGLQRYIHTQQGAVVSTCTLFLVKVNVLISLLL